MDYISFHEGHIVFITSTLHCSTSEEPVTYQNHGAHSRCSADTSLCSNKMESACVIDMILQDIRAEGQKFEKEKLAYRREIEVQKETIQDEHKKIAVLQAELQELTEQLQANYNVEAELVLRRRQVLREENESLKEMIADERKKNAVLRAENEALKNKDS